MLYLGGGVWRISPNLQEQGLIDIRIRLTKLMCTEEAWKVELLIFY
jgi:hypothetical protein